MKYKICIVTGANSGIGKATALQLAQLGAEVVMICRSRERGEQARQELVEKTQNDKIALLLADFSSQKSISDLSQRIQSSYSHIDVLINNAGLIADRYRKTDDGLELTFAVNHMGYFCLTLHLLSLLLASAPARIINVASEVHRGFSGDAEQFEMKAGNFVPMQAYSRSKMANILFTYALAQRLQGTNVTANCLHPGVVATNFGHTGSKTFYAMFRTAKPFFSSAEQGAETPVHLATSPELEGVSGRYFIKKKAVRSSEISYDADLQNLLWLKSEQLARFIP